MWDHHSGSLRWALRSSCDYGWLTQDLWHCQSSWTLAWLVGVCQVQTWDHKHKGRVEFIAWLQSQVPLLPLALTWHPGWSVAQGDDVSPPAVQWGCPLEIHRGRSASRSLPGCVRTAPSDRDKEKWKPRRNFEHHWLIICTVAEHWLRQSPCIFHPWKYAGQWIVSRPQGSQARNAGKWGGGGYHGDQLQINRERK